MLLVHTLLCLDVILLTSMAFSQFNKLYLHEFKN